MEDLKNLETQTPWTRKNTPHRVWSIRREIRRTQEQLAHLLHVSYATVNRWENGHTVPTQQAQEKLEILEERYVRRIKRRRKDD